MKKNKHSVLKVAQEVIARENLNVEKILFVVPKELQIPVVLIKVDGDYQVMFHEFPLGRRWHLKCERRAIS